MAHCLHGWCPSSHQDVNNHAGAAKSKGSSAKGQAQGACRLRMGRRRLCTRLQQRQQQQTKGAKKGATPSVLSLPGGSKQAPAGEMSSSCHASICYGTQLKSSHE